MQQGPLHMKDAQVMSEQISLQGPSDCITKDFGASTVIS